MRRVTRVTPLPPLALAGVALVVALCVPARAQAVEAPTSVSVTVTEGGPVVTWNSVADASRYVMYRKRSGASWEKIATLAASGSFLGTYTYTDDTSLYAGSKYFYRVRVYAVSPLAVGGEENAYSAYVSCKAPALADAAPVVTRSQEDATNAGVTWMTSQYADGYTVEYDTSRTFPAPKSLDVAGRAANAATLTELSAEKSYYVRVRAYQKQGDDTAYARWGYTEQAKAVSTGASKRIKVQETRVKKVRVKVKRTKAQYNKALARAKEKAKKTHEPVAKVSRYRYKTVKRRYKATVSYEVAKAAGQKLGKYDTVQGSCSDGTYAYFVLNNRLKNKCRISKVRLRDMKTVKVSGTLSIAHGNDIAYDSKSKQLVIAQGPGAGLTFPVVSPKTLKVKKRVTVQIPSELPGATSSQLAAVAKSSGVSCVAYDKDSEQLVAVLSGWRRVLYLDGSLVPKRYSSLNEAGNGTRQGAEVVGGMLVVCESPGSGLAINQLHVYDLDGTPVRTVRLTMGNELESLFVAGDKLYASVYASSYGKTSYSRKNYVYLMSKSVDEL